MTRCLSMAPRWHALGSMGVESLSARCCIAGGGPAGMMLGLLLARAGVDTVVLEKHADFLRDFRGDTIHPSTLAVMNEIGLLGDLLAIRHEEVAQLSAVVGDSTVTIADFRHVPAHCGFVAFMPQWDFLNLLAARAARYESFRLRMRAEVTELLEESGRVVGVRGLGADGPIEVRALLVVAADGRSSAIRHAAGLPGEEFGAPMDVLWFRLPRRESDPGSPLGRIDTGRIFVTINRGEHWQCGFVIPKGGVDEIRQRGLDVLRQEVSTLVPFLADRWSAIRDWDDIKLLTVRVDRLTRWYRPGLLCIGDAAHAMSPIGGVGINLAIQDAVAAANLLARPLAEGVVSTDDLRRVQSRRAWPTRVTQGLQLLIQRRVITAVLGGRRPVRPQLIVRALQRMPVLRRIPAYLIGIGIRPEHVRAELRAASGSLRQA